MGRFTNKMSRTIRRRLYIFFLSWESYEKNVKDFLFQEWFRLKNDFSFEHNFFDFIRAFSTFFGGKREHPDNENEAKQ